MIEEMLTEHQYKFLSSPPEKEAKFQKLKKDKGNAFPQTPFNFQDHFGRSTEVVLQTGILFFVLDLEISVTLNL